MSLSGGATKLERRNSSLEILRLICIVAIIFHHYVVHGGFHFTLGALSAVCAVQWPLVRFSVATRRSQWPGLTGRLFLNHHCIMFCNSLSVINKRLAQGHQTSGSHWAGKVAQPRRTGGLKSGVYKKVESSQLQFY